VTCTPDIITAILDGTAPVDLTANKLQAMGIAGSRSYCEMPVGLSATGMSSGCGDGRG